MHQPVLLNEVIELLKPQSDQILVDATIGNGGHSEQLLKLIKPRGRLIGLDLDKNILTLAQQRLNQPTLSADRYPAQIKLFCDNFANLDTVLARLGLTRIDRILLDLGVSSYQLSEPNRGFSFQLNGPLDMRMSLTNSLTAAKIINHYPANRLLKIIQEYGEERWAKRIVKRITQTRHKKPIKETKQLAELIYQTVPRRYNRIHPATRVFQALRIETNNELGNLTAFLNDTEKYLEPNGRLAIISFHSLEDRIVKIAFQAKKKQGCFRIITKKPVRATDEEIYRNPRARSARLRVAEKL